MKRIKNGAECPYTKGRDAGCFCEFCDFVFAITEDNDVDCGYEDYVTAEMAEGV